MEIELQRDKCGLVSLAQFLLEGLKKDRGSKIC